jgi:hypothetical protein
MRYRCEATLFARVPRQQTGARMPGKKQSGNTQPPGQWPDATKSVTSKAEKFGDKVPDSRPPLGRSSALIEACRDDRDALTRPRVRLLFLFLPTETSLQTLRPDRVTSADSHLPFASDGLGLRAGLIHSQTKVAEQPDECRKLVVRIQAAGIRQKPDTCAAKAGFLWADRSRTSIQCRLIGRDSEERNTAWSKAHDFLLEPLDAV